MNLLSLIGLGSQALPNTQDDSTDPITVTAPNGAPISTGNVDTASNVAAPTLSNKQLESIQNYSNLPEHHGLFGTKGTLRDVLGVLGDAFLAQGGRAPIYAPRRQQERESDALAGFVQNPAKAIQSLATVNPDAALNLYNNWQNQNYRNDSLASQEKFKQMQIDAAAQARAADNYDKGSKLFGQVMGGATPETYERMKPLLQRAKDVYGLGDEFEIPDSYDSALAHSYQYGGMTSTQQISNARQDRAQDETERSHRANEGLRSQSNSIAAQRAAKATPGRNPTNASLAAPILSKVQNGQPLTSGEQELLNRLGYPQNRGQKKKAFTLPPVPSGF